MTQPYNALYGPPQAPVDNALYYDDTQGMPRQRPADPLRWLADAVGQNKDLPAPQFFMDPRALSARNMLHSGLNTAANWLDGTKDPSLVGPAEMVSPLGLAGMGMGVANAVTRPGRDFRIADDLARQHPGAAPVASVPYGANLRDASNPTSAAHVYDYGLIPGAPRAPVNTNATPYAVMADNAKGSAPGTVLNSLDMSEAARMSRAREQGFDTERPLYHGTKADFDAFRPSEKGKFGSGVYFSPDRQFADEWTSGNGRVIEAYGRGKMADDAAWAKARDAEYSADGSRSMFEIENAAAKRLQSEGYAGVSSKARGESVVFDPKDIRSTQAAFDPAKRDSAMLLAADNAKGSAPGTVINSLADPEVMAHLEKVQRGNRYADAKLKRAEEKKAAWAERRGTSPAPEMPAAPDSIGGHMMMVPRGIAVTDGNAGWRVTDMPRGDNIRDGIRPAATAGKIEPDYPFGLTMRRSNDIFADNAKGSAPGTVVNSIAEGASRGRSVADELKGLGTDADGFTKAFDALKADKSLKKSDWDELANAYRQEPGVTPFQFKFKNLDEAQKFVRDMFVERHARESKSASIERLFPKDAQASPSASAPGLAANSTQQDDQGVISILRRYGLAD